MPPPDKKFPFVAPTGVGHEVRPSGFKPETCGLRPMPGVHGVLYGPLTWYCV
jgi:hypothetical protein